MIIPIVEIALIGASIYFEKLEGNKNISLSVSKKPARLQETLAFHAV